MAGNIKGRKTILKYGAPTEISFPVTISITRGHNVPNKMVDAEAHRKILFKSKLLPLKINKHFFIFYLI